MATGCTGQDDFQARWKDQYRGVDGVSQVERVRCSQSFPGDLDGCQLELQVDPMLSVAEMRALVADYLERAPRVYREGEVGDRRGSLALLVGRKQYVFAATARDAGGDDGQERTAPDSRQLRLYRDVVDDLRLKAGWIEDRGAGADVARLWLQDDPPDAAWDRIGRIVRELPEARRIAAVVGPPPNEDDRILSLHATIDAGAVPQREWEFVQQVLADEPGRVFTVRIAAGSVHLVELTSDDTSELASSDEHRSLRDRIESRAPDGIDVTVGAGRERDARASTTGEVR